MTISCPPNSNRWPVRFDDLVGRTVVIWGAGREGRAAYSELAGRGIEATIAVSDASAVPADLRHVAVGGPEATERLLAADVVVRSPGVPDTSPDMEALRRRGVAVTGLTALWLADNHQRTIAVTGTKGKSTTSALLHHILGELGVAASLVGNGGTPVTAGSFATAEVAVAEVSSYQAADVTVSPRVVVVTCLHPEHLPWHGDFERYAAAKLNLAAHGPETVVVPDADGDIARRLAALGTSGRIVTPDSVGLRVVDTAVVWDGVGELALDDVPLRGAHNAVNVTLALCALDAHLGGDPSSRAAALAAVATFPPLVHRLETVASDDGRLWVDDSLATAPEAVVAALETFDDQRISLIVGGADRGLSFAPLIDHLASPAVAERVWVVAVGPAGARLVADGAGRIAHVHLAESFRAAMARVRADEFGSDVVLLSPAAPSFDEFASYEERSAAFRAAAAGST